MDSHGLQERNLSAPTFIFLPVSPWASWEDRDLCKKRVNPVTVLCPLSLWRSRRGLVLGESKSEHFEKILHSVNFSALFTSQDIVTFCAAVLKWNPAVCYPEYDENAGCWVTETNIQPFYRHQVEQTYHLFVSVCSIIWCELMPFSTLALLHKRSWGPGFVDLRLNWESLWLILCLLCI